MDIALRNSPLSDGQRAEVELRIKTSIINLDPPPAHPICGRPWSQFIRFTSLHWILRRRGKI